MRKWFWFLPLLSAVSCDSCTEIYGNNYHIVIDSTFSPLMSSVIHTGVDQWILKLQERGINLGVQYETGDCERGVKEEGKICIHYSNTVFFLENGFEPAGFDPKSGGSIALTTRYDNDSSDVWIDMDRWTDNSPLEDFSHSIQHEMGHAFGLEHTRSGVMYWWYDPSSEASFDVADVDVEQYLWYRHLSNQTPDFFH